MRFRGAERIHIAGHTGGVRELATPDLADPRRNGVGRLQSARNFVTGQDGWLHVRGGSRVVQTLADVSGNAISDVLGGFAFSPIGCIVVAHSAAADKHYLYAL